jgi:LDH2 family malate/lactate/ureidoglycolate dehydrogenase
MSNAPRRGRGMEPGSAASERFREKDLLAFCEEALSRMGAPPFTASTVALSLVEADARGVATHGLVRLPSYHQQVKAGEVDPMARPRILRDAGAAVLVDGSNAFGAVTADFGLDLALERAAKFGVGVASAKRCAHFGAAAHYPLRAARRGYICLVASNTPAVMAPYGGRYPAIGNNPLAFAAPMPGEEPPLVFDMAHSVVARGHIKLAEMRSQPIPPGWALGPDGRETTDPTAALAGALLPFGGYKGYGLALIVEALTSVLAGGDLSFELLNTSMTGPPVGRAGAKVGSVGQIFLALDPEAFAGREAFSSSLRRFADAMKAVEPAPGFAEVLVPGEPELRAAETSAAEGVPLARPTVALLAELAHTLSVSLPASITSRA